MPAAPPTAPAAAPQENRQVILITGCSSGIGYDSAHAFRRLGWRVFASCRKPEDCRKLQAEGLESPLLDYQDNASIHGCVDHVMAATGGRLDVLFNNGAFAIPAAVEDLPGDALRAIFEANLFGWHELTRAVLPHMLARGEGRIINNSSVLGFVALPFRGAYNATKFALEGLTDTLRLELGKTPIKLVLIQPGPIRTHIRQNSYYQFRQWIDWRTSRLESVYRDALIPRLDPAIPQAKPDRFELMPDAVSRAVIHAATAKRPKHRYRVTTPTRIMALLKRLLSSRALDWLCLRV